MTIRELVTWLGFKIDDGTLKEYNRKVEVAKQKSAELSNAVSNVGKVVRLIGGAVAAAGITALGKSILETTGEVEQYRVTLGTMIGDQEKANQIIHDLDYSRVSDFYGTAATIGGLQGMVTFGMQAEEASEVLTRLGDIAQGNGEAFQSLSLNMGQVFAKGKADGTDLKQFVGQGFDVVGEVAAMTGKSRAEIEKAGVSYDMCAAALNRITSEGGKYNGMLAKQSRTLPGLVKQFQSLTAAIKESIGTSVIDKVKDLMQYFLDLGRGIQNGIVRVGTRAFDAILKGIADVIIGIEIVKIRMQKFGGAFTPIKALAEDVFSFFVDVMQSSIPLFMSLAQVILLAFKPIQAFVSPALSALKPLFREVFGFGADIIQELLPIIDSLTPAFEYFGNAVSTIIAKVTPIFQNAARAITAMIQPIYSIVSPALSALKPLFDAVFNVIYDGLDGAEKATGTFATIIEGITPIFSVLGNIIGGVVSVFANGLAVILPRLEPIASTLIKITSIILGVIGAIKIWTAVQAALNAVMAMNPIGLIAIGIVGVIGAIALLKKNWESVKPVFEKVCNAIKGFFVALSKAVAMAAAVILAVMFPIPALIIGGLALIAKNWEAVKAGFINGAKKAVEGIKSAWSGVVGFFAKLWSGVVSVALSAFGGIKKIVAKVVSWIKGVFNGLVGFYKGLLATEIAITHKAFDTLKKAVTKVIGGIKSAWSGIKGFFSKLWTGIVSSVKSAWSGVVGFFAKLWSGVVSVALSAFGGIKKIVAKVVSWIKGVFNGLVGFYKGLLATEIAITHKAFDTLKKAVTKVIGGIKSAWSGIKGFFSKLWTGIVSSVKSAWSGVVEFFKRIVEGIKTAFNAIVGFYKKLFEVEVNAIKAVWNGIVAFFETIVEGIKSAFNAIGSFFANLWSGIVENTKSIINGIADAFSAVLEKIKGVWNGITDFFGDLWEKLKDSPLEAITFIEDAFLGMFNKIKENFFGVINTLKDGFEKVKGFFGNVFEGAKEFLFGKTEDEERPTSDRGNPRKVNDLILTPEGAFSTHPDDVIFAMKEPYSLFERLAQYFSATLPAQNDSLANKSVSQSIQQSVSNDYSRSSNQVSYNTPIHVVVNAGGMSAEVARRAVESGVRGALKDAIRGSRGSLSSVEARRA